MNRTIIAAAGFIGAAGVLIAAGGPPGFLRTTASDQAASRIGVLATVGSVLRGVNLSGGEFGRVPGRLNVQYSYPDTSEIDFYRGQGFRLIRVPFRWERLQPRLDGALAPVDRTALRKLVKYAAGQGMTVVLDLHNYAGRQIDGNAAKLGTPALGAAQLTDLWAKLSADFGNDERVWIGLMNEPNGIAAADWWPIAQATVTGLRARGIKNRILVPGTAWTGAHSWHRSGNADQAAKFSDPGRNFAFEVHQYLDRNSSGTSGDCVAGAARRVDAVIEWARTHGVQLFMGEMGAGSSPQCATEYRAMLSSIERSGIFVGWAAWGAGSWWSASYHFRLTPVGWPKATSPTPHLRYLQEFIRENPLAR